MDSHDSSILEQGLVQNFEEGGIHLIGALLVIDASKSLADYARKGKVDKIGEVYI